MPSQHNMIYSHEDSQSPPTSPIGEASTIVTKNNNGESYLTDLVVRAASLCNRMIVEKCAMCTVYCDEQIQYEFQHQANFATRAMSMATFNYEHHSEVQAARSFLFDEDSVVDSVDGRGE